MNEEKGTRISLVIPAAGEGRRMGRRKQYIEIHGKPILQHTLDRFAFLARHETILVVAEGDDAWREVPGTAGCTVVTGGESRADS
ncbi:MAG: 2-C-methyl-D-erythritol 4-phosphate cytidylyltransferase, partial [Pseudomonadales bacterium]|nr:2-C-methyl-D-erythritol 4-phosphate cytidylyltransferase [Pseudomonadales bacterium]